MLHYLFAYLQHGESVAWELFVFDGTSLAGTARSEHEFSCTFKRDVLRHIYQTIISNVQHGELCQIAA
jgi:hypothetical protein